MYGALIICLCSLVTFIGLWVCASVFSLRCLPSFGQASSKGRCEQDTVGFPLDGGLFVFIGSLKIIVLPQLTLKPNMPCMLQLTYRIWLSRPGRAASVLR